MNGRAVTAEAVAHATIDIVMHIILIGNIWNLEWLGVPPPSMPQIHGANECRARQFALLFYMLAMNRQKGCVYERECVPNECVCVCVETCVRFYKISNIIQEYRI